MVPFTEFLSAYWWVLLLLLAGIGDHSGAGCPRCGDGSGCCRPSCEDYPIV